MNDDQRNRVIQKGGIMYLRAERSNLLQKINRLEKRILEIDTEIQEREDGTYVVPKKRIKKRRVACAPW